MGREGRGAGGEDLQEREGAGRAEGQSLHGGDAVDAREPRREVPDVPSGQAEGLCRRHEEGEASGARDDPYERGDQPPDFWRRGEGDLLDVPPGRGGAGKAPLGEGGAGRVRADPLAERSEGAGGKGVQGRAGAQGDERAAVRADHGLVRAGAGRGVRALPREEGRLRGGRAEEGALARDAGDDQLHRGRVLWREEPGDLRDLPPREGGSDADAGRQVLTAARRRANWSAPFRGA